VLVLGIDRGSADSESRGDDVFDWLKESQGLWEFIVLAHERQTLKRILHLLDVGRRGVRRERGGVVKLVVREGRRI
jgi:hypothetical protein